MIISRNWLAEYVKDLPNAKKIAETLTMRAFEVENVEAKNGNEILDVKVLPNRSHDCLCHRGIAQEIAILLRLNFVKKFFGQLDGEGGNIKVEVKEKELCRRYVAQQVEGVMVEKSQSWLKEKLESLGQRSINNMVDITNFIMFDMGQPIHVFDADKIEGNVEVRMANSGEKIETLDGKSIDLDQKILIIADTKGPLAIAGIKGGKRAEVTMDTRNVFFEAGNWQPSNIRKTALKIGLKTDASKRFENDLSPELASEAINYVAALAQGKRLYKKIDIYAKKQQKVTIKVSISEINSLLGTNLTAKDIEQILERTKWNFENLDGTFEITAPFERLDLRIKEDLVEEIGRIYGYENIVPRLRVPANLKPRLNKNFYYAQKIKQALLNKGFGEVFTYAFCEKGKVEVANPISKDKAFLRVNLSEGLEKSVWENMKNAPLLGLDQIKIFEIGAVFDKKGERINVAWSIGNKNGVATEEYGLVEAFEKLVEEKSEENIFELSRKEDVHFMPISPYPFIARDIAVWTPKETKESEVLKLILSNASDLMVQKRLFDKFEKDDKISYAFSLVFQSKERTLTDNEINKIIDKITSVLNAQKNWQVR